MLSISSGHGADYLLGAVAEGRENYYTGAVAEGEPPGLWYGAGAEALGLTGFVDAQDMTALYERFLDPRDPNFRNPEAWVGAATLGHTGRKYLSEDQLYGQLLEREPDASPERRTELKLEAGKRARKNVAFLDATFSVQKSVTVLHTAFEAQQVAAQQVGHTEAAEAWGRHRQAVEDAIWAGNRAALDYLADHAGYARVGHHGGSAGRYTDAHDWTVASFFQHDNRDHDPQLHVHNAILNRVQTADGAWRTLDGRAVYTHRGAAAAVGERTMEEHLTHALGVRFAARPDGKAREVVGVQQQTMNLFSSRRRAITGRTAELAEAFEQKFGRAPNSLELDRLARQATFATRQAKSHEGETREQMLDRWNTALRDEITGGLDRVAADVLALHQDGPAAESWSPSAVLETALADVQAKKAAWTAPDLTRAISDALPDHLGTCESGQVAGLLDTLTAKGLEAAVPLDTRRPGDEALPDELRVANGRSAYDAPGRKLYATPDHVHTERVLTAATSDRDAAALPANAAAELVESLAEQGIVLGPDQAAAVHGILTSGAHVETLVGPAGTGKSFVVGALAHAWTDPDRWDGGRPRRVFGLAASQIAADVLAGEGVDARNVTRWLDTQERLAEQESGQAHPDDEQWRLRGGDLVVIDESAMTGTADLAAIYGHARTAGAKLLLTGDHKQLAAIGAGGVMELLANAGASYELADARRFNHEWERAASLRLRAGDETVLDDYHRHGRLVDAGATEQAESSAARAWLADTLADKDSLLLVDTNEQAARLSAQVRAELHRLGKVAEHGIPLAAQGTHAGVGDLVQARRNGWQLAGYAGNRCGPINRETYRVQHTHDDGALTVAPVHGHDTQLGEQLGEPMTLPADYVAEHLTLGYATTAHAGQGRTVDTSHIVITPATRHETLYVGLSRGRETNTAHVTTRTVPDDMPTGTGTEAVHRAPAAVLASTLEGADPTKSALAVATESADDAASMRTPAELLADAVELATAGRTASWLDELAEHGDLTTGQRHRLAAEDGAGTLTRALRRAELADHQPQQVLRDAVTSRDLQDARQLTNVLYNRIVTGWNLDPTGDTHTSRLPAVDDPEWAHYLHTLATQADQRARELGQEIAEQQPQWALEGLGPIPKDEAERTEWIATAAKVAGHRELAGHDDLAEPLGPAPKAGQVETYASWRAAWRALGRPEADRDELELSDGQLRVRVRAAERETTWAPRYVGNELAGTIQAANAQRRTAQLRPAAAEATTDPAEADRLRREADEATALAETLDRQTEQLREIETARGKWLGHTAMTRAKAERAAAELSARHVDDAPGEDTTTAAEWLDAHRAAQAAEDPHRTITDDYELAEVASQCGYDIETTHTNERTERLDKRAVEVIDRDDQPLEERHTAPGVPDEPAERKPEQHREPDELEQGEPDIRELAADEPAPEHEDDVRVPSQDETAASIERAQRALAEVKARQVEDERREREDRAQQLARWHEADRSTETDRTAQVELS